MLLANGYETKTTFFEDFKIANHFGLDAVDDTFKRVFKEWKHDYIYLTELAIVTNIYCWIFYEKNNDVLSKMYADYYYKVRDYALSHLKGKEFEYYWECTD